MIDSVLLALFLPCLGMSAVLVIYTCLLWYATTHRPQITPPSNSPREKGLSPSELQMIPRVTGKELVRGSECPICLNEIEIEQPARLVPCCKHGFHVACVDRWLSKRPVCPVCMTKLDPQIIRPCENPC